MVSLFNIILLQQVLNETEGVAESTGLKIEPDVLNPVYSSTYQV